VLYILALLPILSVVFLMTARRWGSVKAGPAGWLVGLLVARLAFGMNWDIWWVSQGKGLLLSLNALLILWSALYLYNLVAEVGGVKAVADALLAAIPEPGWLHIVMAWALSGLMESVSGYGLPIAIVAPMLAGLGVPAVSAVAACAVGHAWAVTFGGMGSLLQTLVAVTGVDTDLLVPAAAFLLGVACVLCGRAAAVILGQGKYWKRVLVLGVIMALAQAGAALAGLWALASLLASIAGIGGGILLFRRRREDCPDGELHCVPPALKGALLAYGLLIALMVITTQIPPLYARLQQFILTVQFPEVVSNLGTVTAAGPGFIFRPFLHPATLIMVSAAISYEAFRRRGLGQSSIWSRAAVTTFRAAGPSSVGVIAMVGLSTLMEHTGMTMLLAQGLAGLTGTAFPLVSPLIGILGAFATGSNNNSNVLFGPMQKNVALALGVDKGVLVGAQTAGGSIGSMIAPAKITVGCSTIGLKNEEGLVFRRTLPVGIGTGLLLGAIAWLITVGR